MPEVHLTRWLWQCVVKVAPFMVRTLPQGYDSDTMTYRTPAVDGDGNAVVSGGAMEVIESDSLDWVAASGNPQALVIPADAYGGVSLSNQGSVVVWVSVGDDKGVNHGFRLTVGGYRHLPLRGVTLQLNGVSGSPSVYYVIYGTSS